MMLWKFNVYVTENGRCDTQETIDDYNARESMAFEREVEHLAVTPRKEWQEPSVKDVTPNGKKYKSANFKLYEIRYKAGQRAERALGYFSNNDTFVILLICNHKQKIYDPPDAFEIAFTRFKAHKEGRASSRTLQIDGEDFPQDEEG